MIHPTALIGEPPEHRDYQGGPVQAPVIAASARIGAFVTVDAGLIWPTIIGPRTWLMKHVHVGHDAEIGSDCELAPGTVIGGHVRIGNGVRIGVNACVRPFITIGDGARIGAGAVVVKDVPPGEVWAGNPAKRLQPKTETRNDLVAEGWEEWWARREALTRCD